MKDEHKTKAQLITELEQTRKRVAELERAGEALRDSVEEYRTIYENVPEVLIRVDKYGTIVSANDHSATFGRKPEDIIGKKFTELGFFDLKDIPKYWALFKGVIAGKKTIVGMELEVKHRDGHKIPIEVNTSLFLKNGKIEGFVSVARDISERKQAEEALRESEEKYRTIFEATGTATAIVEEDTTLALVNSQFEKLSGYSKEEIEGKKSWTEFVAKDDLERMKKYHYLRRTAADAAPRNYGFRFVGRYGKVKNIFLTVAMIPGTKKSVTSLLDITERSQAAEALRVLEEKFRSLFEHVPVGVYQGTPGGRLFTVNPALVDMLGYDTADEMRGDNQIRDLYLNPEDWESLVRELESKSELRNVEVALKRKDGTPITALENVSTARYKNGRVRYYEGMFIDITERKRAAMEIQRQTEELTLLNDLNLAANEGASLADVIELLSKETGMIFSGLGAAVYLLSDDRGSLVMKNMPLDSKLVKKIEQLAGMKLPELHFPERADSLYWQVLNSRIPMLLKDDRLIEKQVLEYVNEMNIPNATLRKSVRKLVPQIRRLMGIKNSIIVPLCSEEGAIGIVDISSEDKLTEADLHRLEVLAGQLTGIIARKQAEEALRESEEKYRSLVESSEDPIYLIDKEHQFLFANEKYLSRLGKSLDEVVGRKLSNFDIPQKTEKFSERINEVLTSRKPATYEHRSARDNRDFVRTLSPVIDPNTGRATAVTVISKDITERKLAEEALRESEGRYRELADSITDIFFAFDKNLRYTYWNKASEELTGIGAQDAIGKSLYEIFPDSPQTRKAEKVYREVLETQQPKTFINEYEIKGREFFFEISVYPSRDGIAVFTKDITERKLVEEALKRDEQFLSGIFDSVQDGISVLDTDLTILHVNKAVNEWYAANTPLEGKKCYKSYYNRRIPCKSCPTLRCLESRKVEWEIVPGEPGSPIEWLELFSYPMVDRDSGEIVGVVEFARDITERKQTEEELAQSRKRLRNLSLYLQRVREEERGEVAREIHDELGQELTAIKMDLSWLSNKLPQDQQLLRDRVGGMTELANSMIQTVKRITSELRPAVLDDLGVAAALEWEIGEFRKRTGLTCELVIEPAEFELDPSRSTAIYRIFQESLTNVARHAQATAVSARLAAGPETVVLVVKDDGIGIPKEQLQSQEAFGLIGIRERAGQFGGEALITSVVGEGTIVTVEIPYEESEVHDD